MYNHAATWSSSLISSMFEHVQKLLQFTGLSSSSSSSFFCLPNSPLTDGASGLREEYHGPKKFPYYSELYAHQILGGRSARTSTHAS